MRMWLDRIDRNVAMRYGRRQTETLRRRLKPRALQRLAVLVSGRFRFGRHHARSDHHAHLPLEGA